MTDAPDPRNAPAASARSSRRRARRLAFSALLFLVFLEGGLRVLGALVTAPLPPADPVEKPPGTAHVLCVGDSFTFGVGAAGGESYPDHLERLLNERAGPGRKYRVFNRGVPGSNSAMVRRRLPVDLARFRPDFVLILAGNNNAWNPEGTDFLNRRRAKTSGLLVRADRLAWSSRVYRLAKYLLRSPNPALAPPPETERSRRRKRAADAHRAELARLPAEYRAILERGYEHVAAGRYAKAVREFRKAVAAGPGLAKARIDLADAFRRLGNVEEERRALAGDVPEGEEGARVLLSRADLSRRLGKFDEAARWYGAAKERAGGALKARALAGLGGVALDRGQFSDAENSYRRSLAMDPDHPRRRAMLGAALVGLGRAGEARENLWRSVELGEDVSFVVSQLLVLHRGDNRALRKELRARAADLEKRLGRSWVAYVLEPYIAWHDAEGERAGALVADLAAMLGACETAGAAGALLVYPHGRLRAETRRAAANAGAPVLDSRDRFETLERSARKDEYFVADGHLTGKGYALLARAPADWILAAGVD